MSFVLYVDRIEQTTTIVDAEVETGWLASLDDEDFDYFKSIARIPCDFYASVASNDDRSFHVVSV